MFELKDTEQVPANSENINLKCCYCSNSIEDEDYLHCIQCRGHVHVKCLKHSSTPGDLMGDVFFEFTCAKCMQLEYDGPSTSTGCAKEKFVRQRLPWILVITLALYNLSIKSKGLSRHGYFHWRTHVVNFIERNWEYLFEPHVKKRKQWIGSVTGNISHNSPDFFVSGQEKFGEAGWWKLAHENKHPRYIYSLYEQFSQKRSQMRNGKRSLEDSNSNSKGSTTSFEDVPNEVKRLRLSNEENNMLSKYSCSRTIPYMGRKPKVLKQLNSVDEDLTKAIKTDPEPLNTVQSSLMDFLAESLASADLNLFNNFPNIAAEPLVEDNFEKNDFLLSSLTEVNDNINLNEETTTEAKSSKETIPEELITEKPSSDELNTKINQDDLEKLKSFYKQIEVEDISEDMINLNNVDENSIIDPTANDSTDLSSVLKTVDSEDANFAWNDESIGTNIDDEVEGDTEDEEYQPRIVQITNFQQLDADPEMLEVKTESDDEERKCDTQEAIKTAVQNIKNEVEIEDDYEDSSDSYNLPPPKPSLFTKHPKREYPWITENNPTIVDIEPKIDEKSETGEMISVYEERSMLRKLRTLLSDRDEEGLDVPPVIRRFYRKLCIREWKRQHNKPIFDIDTYITGKPSNHSKLDANPTPLDRYHLIAQTTPNPRHTFYQRIMGSTDYELFQSPYTGHILTPFIFRSKECVPPWLKLMLELQYCVNGIVPKRHPIDFCYVRPNHIPAVNTLLQTMFWPGIDMSESLKYPDYSVVALYKKLVVGCGFIEPDATYNEAYISFMAVRPGWQNSGIATIMLYHLIQSCLDKDIILHVSATNPAVLLYQKFGFKIQEVILEFYDKYLPLESKDSTTALLLRLNR